MKKQIALSFVLILLFCCTAYTQQRGVSLKDSPSEKRVALIIGNSAYEVAALKNPINDARDMAQTLAALGFEVIHRENLNQNDMKRAIRDFGAKLRSGGVGLFYYAGHGVQVKGINYLVPVNAKIESEEEVEYECVDAGFVLAQMETAGNSMNIVILDACRNNPFARSFRSASRGLAQMDAPSGTLIAYATAPGSVASDGNARNGLYTQELLKFVRTPNLGIEDVFKQVRISVRNLTQGRQTPWESSSLTGDFYFAGSTTTKGALSTNNPPTGAQPNAVEPLPSNKINSNSISGKYLNTKNPASYIELKSDGTFFLSQVFSGRVFQNIGKYEVDSKQITLKLEMGQAARGTIENDRISFEDGSVYARGSAETVSASPPANQEVTISMAFFTKSPAESIVPSQLTIGGSGWDGGSDIKVIVNGQDISKQIDHQMAYNITLKGTTKELNMRDGKNEVIVIVNASTSNKYEFKQAIK